MSRSPEASRPPGASSTPVTRVSSLKLSRDRAQRREELKLLQEQAIVEGVCKDPDCDSTEFIEEEDGTKICAYCGEVQNDAEKLHADIEFHEEEDGVGVYGAQVRDGERHARSTVKNIGKMGGGPDSREKTEGNARRYIHSIIAKVGETEFAEGLDEQAFMFYKLALNAGFTRRLDTLLSVCLYLAARSHRPCTLLLIDFAVAVQRDIYELGKTYKELKKVLCYDEQAIEDKTSIIIVEDLIAKFAAQLEFGDREQKVISDATALVKRMRRDWMIEGRGPAGVCGACILLAARMNNFSRSLREVVFVVRVTDITVMKRVEEFERTKSSQFSVADFRKYGEIYKDASAEPPAIYKARELEEKRRRQAEALEDDSSSNSSNDSSVHETDSNGKRKATPNIENSNAPKPVPKNKKRKTSGVQSVKTAPNGDTGLATPPASQNPPQKNRRDADGFAIPDVPVDPSIVAEPEPAEAPPVKRGRGRPPKNGISAAKQKKKKEKIVPTEAELLTEKELEDEINYYASDPRVLEETLFSDENVITHYAMAETIAKERGYLTRERAPLDATPDDGDLMALDDCSDIKEAFVSQREADARLVVWTNENEDFLREEQARKRRRTLKELKEDEAPKRKKRKVMGDGSLLAGSPAADAAEATERMLLANMHTKAASKFLDRDALQAVYGSIRVPASRGSSGNDQSSRSASDAGAADADAAAAAEEEDEDPYREPSARPEQALDDEDPELAPEADEEAADPDALEADEIVEEAEDVDEAAGVDDDAVGGKSDKKGKKRKRVNDDGEEVEETAEERAERKQRKKEDKEKRKEEKKKEKEAKEKEAKEKEAKEKGNKKKEPAKKSVASRFGVHLDDDDDEEDEAEDQRDRRDRRRRNDDDDDDGDGAYDDLLRDPTMTGRAWGRIHKNARRDRRDASDDEDGMAFMEDFID